MRSALFKAALCKALVYRQVDRVEHNQSFSDFTYFTMVIIFLKIIEKNLYAVSTSLRDAAQVGDTVIYLQLQIRDTSLIQVI